MVAYPFGVFLIYLSTVLNFMCITQHGIQSKKKVISSSQKWRVPNFVATMENFSAQMRTSAFGLAITGSGIDTNSGLAPMEEIRPMILFGLFDFGRLTPKRRRFFFPFDPSHRSSCLATWRASTPFLARSLHQGSLQRIQILLPSNVARLSPFPCKILASRILSEDPNPFSRA